MAVSMIFDYAAQPKQTVTECNLCRGTRFEPFASRDRYGLPVRSVRCQTCLLVFIDPHMTAAAYAEFYRDGIYRQLLSIYYGRPVTAETIEAEQAAYAERLCKLLESRVNGHDKTLLDIGGSTGVVAEAVRNRFRLDATLLEPSEAEGDRARKRGLRVIEGTLDSVALPDRYDLVLLCQTSDHLIDLRGTLLKIRNLLTPEGLFFVDIVDYRIPLEARGREGTIKVDHPLYLEPFTMNSYLLDAGFITMMRGASEDGLHYNYLCRAAHRMEVRDG